MSKLPVYQVVAEIECNIEAETEEQAIEILRNAIGNPIHPQPQWGYPLEVEIYANENLDHSEDAE